MRGWDGLDDDTEGLAEEPDEADWRSPDLGSCCSCESTGPSVRNILMLPQLAPIPGRGWGCVQCGPSRDGAVAVVCDACLESKADLRFACRGWPGEDGRVPIGDLAGAHRHDERFHAAELAVRRGDDRGN